MQNSPSQKPTNCCQQQNSTWQLQSHSTKSKHKSFTSMDFNPEASKHINKNSNKKRFSDDQIKSLESIFSSESRPGSKTKQQIADQLGLQPHQVAVWFQNRRARTKSKKAEQDYAILRARYDNLASKFEVLKKEKQNLIIEVQRLKGSEGSPRNITSETAPAACSSNGESTSLSSPEKHIAQPEDYVHDMILSDTKIDGFKNFEQETCNQESFNMINSADRSLASSRNHGSPEITYLIQHNYLADWWEFWT